MRSQRLFESYPGCPVVPPPAVEPADDAATLARLGVADTPLARQVTGAAFSLSGFDRFVATLPERFDEIASDGVRPAPAQTLTISAVQALADVAELGDPLRRAASLLAAAWELHADLRAGRFEPDRHEGRPLESRLYANLFGTSFAFDGSGFALYKTESVSRIAVMARRRMYVVDFDDSPAEGPPVGAIERALLEVRALSRQERPEPPGAAMGILTCARSETRRRAFRILREDPRNRACDELLKNTFVTLCLDLELAPPSHAAAAAAAFTGNCANRWFHSSLQVVVFGNARAALIYNFAAIPSGGTMGRASHELHRRAAAIARAGRDGDVPAAAPAAVRELRWNRRGLPFAEAAADARTVMDNQQSTFDLAAVGRDALRAMGLRPVEAFVAAVQLAAFRLTGRCPTVAQFVATSGYSCGGVATARVSTPEMAALQAELRKPEADPAALRALFEAGAESQRAACRRVRTHIPLFLAMRMYRRAQSGVRRMYVESVFRAGWFVLRKCRQLKPYYGDDIVLSQPGISPEVPVIGRPGARVPFCHLFALHYDILDDRIRITIMPSTTWTIPNAELVAEIESSLATLCSRLAVAEMAAQPA